MWHLCEQWLYHLPGQPTSSPCRLLLHKLSPLPHQLRTQAMLGFWHTTTSSLCFATTVKVREGCWGWGKWGIWGFGNWQEGKIYCHILFLQLFHLCICLFVQMFWHISESCGFVMTMFTLLAAHSLWQTPQIHQCWSFLWLLSKWDHWDFAWW